MVVMMLMLMVMMIALVMMMEMVVMVKYSQISYSLASYLFRLRSRLS